MYFNKTWTPAAASLTGFASNVTGASWTLTANDAGDSLAHTVTIRNDAAVDHSAKTVTITGTDADGNTQTETGNLPGVSATVTYTKYFRTVTSVVPSATINADTMDIGWSAVSVGQTIGLEKFSTATAAIAVGVTGTVNFSIQETPEDFYNTPQQNGVWVSISALAAKTANVAGSSTQSMRGVRLLVNSVTAGATLRVTTAQGISP
jgi:hypothetical protein